MDERLDAGRHHLHNGDAALSAGHPDEAKSHFEAALLQFRGPELRLGEAHAIRGLAQVDLASGRTDKAEQAIRQALSVYRGLVAMLEQLDPEGLSEEVRAGANDGIGASYVVLAEVLVRKGRGDEAREQIRRAQDIFGDRELPGAAGLFMGLGRLALREGRYDEAEAALDRALSIHVRNGDLVGQVGTALTLAELWRVRGDVRTARETLEAARSLVRERQHARLEGRVVAALAALSLQSGDLDDARDHYYDALALVRDAGDLEMEGYALLGLGEVESRCENAAALEFLIEGARTLAGLQHEHGFAGALLRIGEHAMRIGQADLALAASEGARRLWRRSDPVRGVGQALRIVVKALAEQESWRPALTASVLRARVAGAIQPNARDVADHYIQRAPASWVRELDALSDDALEAAARDQIVEVLAPVLEPLRISTAELADPDHALVVVESLAARIPRTLDDTEETEIRSARPGEPTELFGDPAPAGSIYDDLSEDVRSEDLS